MIYDVRNALQGDQGPPGSGVQFVTDLVDRLFEQAVFQYENALLVVAYVQVGFLDLLGIGFQEHPGQIGI